MDCSTHLVTNLIGQILTADNFLQFLEAPRPFGFISQISFLPICRILCFCHSVAPDKPSLNGSNRADVKDYAFWPFLLFIDRLFDNLVQR